MSGETEWSLLTDMPRIFAFANLLAAAIVVILAFSLLAYMLTYSFRVPTAQRFAALLACVVVVYASEVALTRVASAMSATRWLRFEWLGIAMLPAAYYLFSLAVLATTNYRINRRRWVGAATLVISTLCAADALFGTLIVDQVHYAPLVSYLDAGPLFWAFAAYFALAFVASLVNILKARARCLTENSRRRINFLLLGYVAPGVGVFPYLIALGRHNEAPGPNGLLFAVSLIGNLAVAAMLVIMAYTVSYFGVLTPDRVVRYRMVRYFMRGPVVAILVILAVLTVPRIEGALGLPRDIVLFSVITGVIVFSQLFLSVTKSVVDRLIYREDRNEVAWLRELDRRLLTTSDLHQFLENNLVALCELLRVPSGFVAAMIGPDLMLEAVVGPSITREQILGVTDWSEALSISPKSQGVRPITHEGFWIWPLFDAAPEDGDVVTLGMLGVHARTAAPLLSKEEMDVLARMLDSITRALADRRLQQGIFVTLRNLMPDIERVQRLRVAVPYASADENAAMQAEALLDDSLIHSPEFEAWVKDALSHYWGGPKLTHSPLMHMRVVSDALDNADDDPTKALRLVIGAALERLRPDGKQNFTAPEWLLYNILELRFIQGRKVREIADRLAMSESDLYRKQRVAIGHLARVISEMEQENATTIRALAPGNGAATNGLSGNGAATNVDD